MLALSHAQHHTTPAVLLPSKIINWPTEYPELLETIAYCVCVTNVFWAGVELVGVSPMVGCWSGGRITCTGQNGTILSRQRRIHHCHCFCLEKVSRIIISEKEDKLKSGPVGKTNHNPGKGCGWRERNCHLGKQKPGIRGSFFVNGGWAEDNNMGRWSKVNRSKAHIRVL